MLLPSIRLLIVSLCFVGPCYTASVTAAEADQKALVTRVEQLVGQVTKNKSGEIIAIDLDNRAATDNDLKLLAAAPSLEKLAVWGVGISDAGIDHLLSLKKLSELELLNTRITDAGLAKLVALKKLAAELLNYDNKTLAQAIASGVLIEVNCDEKTVP